MTSVFKATTENNRKPVCDFLSIVSELSQRTVQNLDTLCFSPSLHGGLGKTYDGLSWAHWKARSVLPIIVLIELFSLGVTAEALRAKIDRKSAIFSQRGQFDPKFQVEGIAPPIIFARIVRPMNALQLCRWQFSHKETL